VGSHPTRPSSLVVALAAAVALGVAPRPAEATIVERIVAVVGERPILLSELRHRALPHRYRIAMSVQNPTQLAQAESELYRELLTRMIDERLEEQAADKAHLTVTPEEVDNGIRQVASQSNLAPRDVIEEAKRQGLTEQDYRDEIRRQVLEGKLMNLRVRNRVRVSEVESRAAYTRWAREVTEQSPVDVRFIVLNVGPGATQQDTQDRITFAEEITGRARAGEDFCQLVLDHSEEPTLKDRCGSRGPIPISSLPNEIQGLATSLKPGQTGDPVFFRDAMGNSAVLVVQLAPEQPKLPSYEEVREQMMERAFYDALERQKKLWLQELRRGVYIDVRL
jgi:peptidyl-prolyl cis-trans isomerase SurA